MWLENSCGCQIRSGNTIQRAQTNSFIDLCFKIFNVFYSWSVCKYLRVREHVETEGKMQEDCIFHCISHHIRHFNTIARWSLVKSQEQIFVYPVSSKHLKHPDYIQKWHSRRIYHHYIECSYNLWVSDLNKKLWPCILRLKVLLKSLASFFPVTSTPSIYALLQPGYKYSDYCPCMGRHNIYQHSERYRWPNGTVPFYREIVVLTCKKWNKGGQIDFRHSSIN